MGVGLSGGHHTTRVFVFHRHGHFSILRTQVSKHLQACDTRETGVTIVQCVQIDRWGGCYNLTNVSLINIMEEAEGFLAN